MPNLSISQLPSISAITNTDIIPIVSSGITYKVACGLISEIKPYGHYIALLTQTGTTAPVSIILENTLGFTPNWVYVSEGTYSITQSNSFPIEKTYTNTSFMMTNNNVHYYSIDNINFPNTFIVKTLSGNDNSLYYTPIEIRVYN